MNELQRVVSDWVKDRPTLEVNNTFPRVVDLLRGEVDELVDAQPNGHNDEIAQEVADVFIYALTLANLLNVDVDSVVREKMAFNSVRYPAHTYQGEITYEEAMQQNRQRVKDKHLKEEFYG